MIGNAIGIPFNQKQVNTPTLLIAPLLSGVFEVGESVSCSTGTWIGKSPITYTYQWKLNGVSIISATSSSYTIVLSDDTKTLTCEVTATNDFGSSAALSNSKTVGSNWILRDGTWDDSGVWEDSAVWID